MLRLLSDSTSVNQKSYTVGVLRDAPRQLHREQTAPNQPAYGSLLQGVTLGLELLSLARRAPNKAKKANPIQAMNTQSNAVAFCIVLASYLTAGLMGVAFVQSAAENAVQHSGTQRYVRVVR